MKSKMYDWNTGEVIEDSSELISAAEVAELCGVHTKTVQRWARLRLIPIAGTTAGGRKRYRKVDIMRWFADNDRATA